MKKILVAVDVARSGGNDKILEAAQTIASATDGELFLMHALEPIPARVRAEVSDDALSNHRTHAEEAMQDLMDKTGCKNGVVREGPASPQILRYAEEIHADLIVMHSHDPDMTDYIIGSVAGRVVRHAHCSVHIVREAKAGS